MFRANRHRTLLPVNSGDIVQTYITPAHHRVLQPSQHIFESRQGVLSGFHLLGPSLYGFGRGAQVNSIAAAAIALIPLPGAFGPVQTTAKSVQPPTLRGNLQSRFFYRGSDICATQATFSFISFRQPLLLGTRDPRVPYTLTCKSGPGSQG